MQERRTTTRVDVQVTGLMMLAGGIALPCRIRDLSRGGAQLVLPEAETAPERFGLRIASSATVREVAVTWRRGGELGVRFL